MLDGFLFASISVINFVCLTLGLPLLVAGILFLLCWQKSR